MGEVHQTSFVDDLAVVLGVAAVTFVIFRRLRQPAVLGYLFAGLIVGPYIPIPLFADPHRVHALSEFGVVLVMFAIGLEFRLARLLRVLPISGVTGLMQMGALLWLGTAAGSAFGWNTVQSLFLGASIAISSTMVVSAVFSERPVSADVRELVLGVLVLQDVAAIVLIATMTLIAGGEVPSTGDLIHMLGRLAVVLVSLVAVGLFVVPRAVRLLSTLGSTEGLVIGATGLCFVMAIVAESLGYSVALGAFVAGILVAESGRGEDVEHAIAPLKHVFSAVFFVSVGMTVDPRLAMDNLGPALIVAGLVVAGQLLSVTLGGLLSGSGLRKSLGAGLALGQIGEFAFIIAGIGDAAGILPEALSPMLVTVAIATAFTTPLAIAATPHLVHAIDRQLPARVHAVLVAYETWFERIRDARSAGVDRPPRRRATVAVVVDGLALVALAALWRTQRFRAGDMLASQLPIEPYSGRILATAAAMLVAMPLLWILLRNTDHLARMAIGTVRESPGQDAALGIPPNVAEALLYFAFRATVLLGVGIPAAALLRPLFGAPYVGTAVLVLLGLVALFAWRSVHHPSRGVRSAAEAMLMLVSNQRAELPVPVKPDPLRTSAIFPGTDSLHRCALARGMHAVGETLHSLNLRAKTGATVVAIHRPGSPVLVPTGGELLQVDDVLVLAGTRDALGQAEVLLQRGAVDAS